LARGAPESRSGRSLVDYQLSPASVISTGWTEVAA
jgi:hypothetical protein